MKALVTGAAGFIGSTLCEHLVGQGARVTGIDSFTDYYPRELKTRNLQNLLGQPNSRFLESRIQDADLKGLLAYSTISHLGLITLLLGLSSPLATVAAIFHTINHATFKASLFMAAGIIDHETGTRDIRRLSGLFRFMPITATLAGLGVGVLLGLLLAGNRSGRDK